MAQQQQQTGIVAVAEREEEKSLWVRREKKDRTLPYGLVLRLFVCGEFKVLVPILLVSSYAAAILSIPLVLGSIFGLSTTLLGATQAGPLQGLLYSVYLETQASYSYVAFTLFLGLGVACVLSGMTIGRRTARFETLLRHLGIPQGKILRSMLLFLLLVSLACGLLSFSLSVALSSAALYSISLAFRAFTLEPIIGGNYLLYLILEEGVVFAFLSFGWYSTSNLRRREQ